MKTTYKDFINESYERGDSVKLKYDIERDPDDGEYGYSVDAGEIGEIRYEIGENDKDENKIYMIKFPDDKDKQGSLNKGRYVQLTQQSFTKETKAPEIKSVEMTYFATRDGYNYWIGTDEKGKKFYNVTLIGYKKPTSGYYNSNYVCSVRKIENIFE